MKRSIGFKWILTAMFASMVCVCTLCVQIPSPMNGYINLGDVLVLISAFLLGARYGTLAAGLGSALADLFSGYALYAPGTLVIKAATAFFAAILSERGKDRFSVALRRIVAALVGEAVMVLGYLFYAWFFLAHGPAAIASIPGNMVQGAAGMLLSVILTPLITRPREVQEMLACFQKNSFHEKSFHE